MSGFPLYDNLISNLPKKDLTVKQKEAMIADIPKLDHNGKELVYTLIKYYNKINDETPSQLPYKGQSEDSNEDVGDDMKNITWCITDLPHPLRQLLYKFIIMHIKKLEEDCKRDTNI